MKMDSKCMEIGLLEMGEWEISGLIRENIYCRKVMEVI